jgi:hypothetical protein
MAAAAIEAYLESLQKDGEPLPESDAPTLQPATEQIRVRLALEPAPCIYHVGMYNNSVNM